jgi:type IV pilus assembly protein PilF
VSRLVLAALLAASLLAAGCATNSSSGREIDSVSAADSNVKLGFAAMSSGDLARAKEKFERAAKQDPKSADAQFGLAELYSRLEQPKEAERFYRNAIDMAPDKLEIVNGYAAFLCSSGQVDRGIAQFERLMNNPLYARQAAAATNAGMCLRNEKRHADSVRYFETALAKQPDWIEAVVQLADVSIDLEKPAMARKAVDNYQSMRNSATVLVMGVRAAVAQRDCSGAEAYTRKLRGDFPNSREYLVLLPQVLGSCARSAPL